MLLNIWFCFLPLGTITKILIILWLYILVVLVLLGLVTTFLCKNNNRGSPSSFFMEGSDIVFEQRLWWVNYDFSFKPSMDVSHFSLYQHFNVLLVEEALWSSVSQHATPSTYFSKTLIVELDPRRDVVVSFKKTTCKKWWVRINPSPYPHEAYVFWVVHFPNPHVWYC